MNERTEKCSNRIHFDLILLMRRNITMRSLNELVAAMMRELLEKTNLNIAQRTKGF